MLPNAAKIPAGKMIIVKLVSEVCGTTFAVTGAHMTAATHKDSPAIISIFGVTHGSP